MLAHVLVHGSSWKHHFSSCSDQRHCFIFKTLLFPFYSVSDHPWDSAGSFQNKSRICPALSHLCCSLLGPNTFILLPRYGNSLLTGPLAFAAFHTTPLPVSFQEGRGRYVLPGIPLCESHCLSPMPRPLQGSSLWVKAKLKFSWCTVLTGHPHVSAHTHIHSCFLQCPLHSNYICCSLNPPDMLVSFTRLFQLLFPLSWRFLVTQW